MEDFIGQKINEGDYLFYVSGGRYGERSIARVIAIMKKMIKIEKITSDRGGTLSFFREPKNVWPCDCLKLSTDQVKFFIGND